MQKPAPKPEIANVTWGNGGCGWIGNGKFYLEHCGKCGLENYLPLVSSGRCAWCGDVPQLEHLNSD